MDGGLSCMIRFIGRGLRAIAYPIRGQCMFTRKAGELDDFFKSVSGRRALSRY